MGSERFLDKLLSVFDLTICKALELPESVSTRVMFLYDREGGHKEFLVSNNGLPKDLVDQVTSWLEKNIDAHNITSILKANKLDADDLLKGLKTGCS
jgi:hypothetical protein